MTTRREREVVPEKKPLLVRALEITAVAVRKVVAMLVRAPLRKQLVAERARALKPVLAPLLERGEDGVMPFHALRTQTVLRSAVFRQRRDVALKGPR